MLAIAVLYASMGLGGSSGYLAVMGLFEIDPGVMKPVALSLNIVVTSVGVYKFRRAGFFSWRLFWPFAVTSVPFAYLGGKVMLHSDVYRLVVGGVLVFAAYRLFASANSKGKQIVPPLLWVALISGAAIGLVAGVLGTGGGIFISPLILLMGWAEQRTASAVTALFVMVNSIAGLLGHVSSMASLPPQILYWGAVVLVGGWIGAEYGSRHLPGALVRQVLSVVVFVGGIKMIVVALTTLV